MAELNIPNSNNYTVIAGTNVWISRRDSSDELGEYLPVGNVAEDLTLSFELERLENFTNLYGLDTRDRNVVIAKSLSFNVVINEFIRENLVLLMGSSGREINQTINVRQPQRVTLSAGATGSAQVNNGAAIVDVEKVLPISGEDEYDEGVSADYTVNIANGTITRVASGNIGIAAELHVYYRKAVTDATKHPIMDDPNISGAIHMVSSRSSANGVGYNQVLEFGRVDIAPDGDIVFAKRDWIKGTLKCDALADATSPTSALGYMYTYNDA